MGYLPYVENGDLHAHFTDSNRMLDKRAAYPALSPGRALRVDSDATHCLCSIAEGFRVEEGVTLPIWKAVFTDFIRRFFERDDLQVRFRPSFFLFTEPSAEIDIMGETANG